MPSESLVFMADPRPTADDPLVIFGSVSLPARQGPSTVNPPFYGGSSGGIPNFGDPQLGCSCLCCPPMPPGCMIWPLPCECACCSFLSFPPLFSCGAACSPAGSYSLVLERSGNQTVTGTTGTVLSFDTVVHNRGFFTCGCVSSVTIPKTGLWSISAKTAYTCTPPSIPCEAYLTLLKCCAICADFNFVIHNCIPAVCGCCAHWPAFGFTTVNTYDAGQVLKVKGNFDASACSCWKSSRFSLYLVGESC